MNAQNLTPQAVFLPPFLLPFTGFACYRDGLISVLFSHASIFRADLQVWQFDFQACRQNGPSVGLLGAT
jgi:hypothetical protein